MKSEKSLPPPIDASEFLKLNLKRPKLIKNHKGYIGVLLGKRHEYEIEKDRMDTASKVLGWIHHLCEKDDITPEHLAQLIEAAEALGVQVDRNA